MPYTIEVSENKHYIITTVEGDLTNAQAIEQNIKAHQLGASMGISRYLVDLTASRYLGTTLDHYEFAYKDMQGPDMINRNARVALLAAQDDYSHDFVETVSRNNGMDVSLFRDRQAAINHLEKD